jgi:beta-lactamase class A
MACRKLIGSLYSVMNRNLESKSPFRKFLIPALALLAGLSVGFMLRGLIPEKSKPQVFEVRQGGWTYINPLLECEQAQNLLSDTELKPMRDHLEKFIGENLKRRWGDEVSVYFRELNDGLTFDIGKESQFYPASLLKVPEMISVLKKAETTPQILTKRIAYNDPDLKPYQNTDVADKLVFGRSYTVEDLMKRTIDYSDNLSSLLLEETISEADRRKIYDDLGIPDPYYLNDQSGYMLSVELYSSFFRILFNASYLNREMSEKALEYLAKTDYTKGLVAGVPPKIKVAHKFGLRKINGIKQLHDCGIVYYPDHPYLLCVMTSGPIPEYLDTTIAEISGFIYEEIDRQHR